MKAKILNRLISELKTREKPYEIRDTELRGFILRVQPTGSKTFYAEYGRGKRISIGRADTLTVAQARDEAKRKLANKRASELAPTRPRLAWGTERVELPRI